jgi:translation elongation factor EF-1alpha
MSRTTSQNRRSQASRKNLERMLDCHTASDPCRFSQITEKIDRRSGKIQEINPKFFKSSDSATVVITPTKPLSSQTSLHLADS